ncbi:MAG TPA: SCO family protein [Pyrinomonadaceae bacterium]|nr:SCO family protein [Pyrinomonadaceae bacterium]
MTIEKRVLQTGLILFVFVASQCGGAKSENEKRYPLTGKVIAINKTEKTATINHDEIPGYMEKMTMEFKVKNDSDLDRMNPGDRVTGDLVVTDTSSWIEIMAITQGGAELTPTSVVPGEPKPGDEIADFALVNQDGKPIRLSQYKGKALALTFIYTRCPQPDQCTLMSTHFAAVEKELQQKPDVFAKTHLLSITFDPEYDTPRVMRSYGASHSGRYSDEVFKHWEFATGTAEQVKAIAEYFGVRSFKDPATGKDELVHSLRTAVIDPQGKLVKLYRGNEWKPADIAADLKSLVQTAN